MKRLLSTVKNCRQIAEAIYEIILFSPAWHGDIMSPGQFAHIKLPHQNRSLLRRPISIMDFDPETAEMKLVIQIAGEGTKELIAVKPGDEIDIIAPLGRGFSLGSVENQTNASIYLCGGGVGIAPLFFAANTFSKTTVNIEAFLGYRTAEHVFLADEFMASCKAVSIHTNDGSMGKEGFVTDSLVHRIAEKKPDIILACGPLVMLKTVQNIAVSNNIHCQISLEERMGCGVGACLVCNCKTRLHPSVSKDPANETIAQFDETYTYSRVCADGPVFSAYEVIFDE